MVFYHLTYEVTNSALLSMPASGGTQTVFEWIGLFLTMAAILIVLRYPLSGGDAGHRKEGSI